MAYVYRHSTLDTNEAFYIGIGSDSKYKRAKSKSTRNKFWHSVVNKHGYKVDILLTDLTWEEACDIERHLISKIGRRDIGTGSLVNMTEGGDGMLGFVFSDEALQKMSKAQKGRKHTEETKLKMSKVQKGRGFSEESRIKMSNSQKGLHARGKNPKAKITLDVNTGIYYDCLVDAANARNLKYQDILDSLRGKRKAQYGLIYV